MRPGHARTRRWYFAGLAVLALGLAATGLAALTDAATFRGIAGLAPPVVVLIAIVFLRPMLRNNADARVESHEMRQRAKRDRRELKRRWAAGEPRPNQHRQRD